MAKLRALDAHPDIVYCPTEYSLGIVFIAARDRLLRDNV